MAAGDLPAWIAERLTWQHKAGQAAAEIPDTHKSVLAKTLLFPVFPPEAPEQLDGMLRRGWLPLQPSLTACSPACSNTGTVLMSRTAESPFGDYHRSALREEVKNPGKQRTFWL